GLGGGEGVGAVGADVGAPGAERLRAATGEPRGAAAGRRTGAVDVRLRGPDPAPPGRTGRAAAAPRRRGKPDPRDGTGGLRAALADHPGHAGVPLRGPVDAGAADGAEAGLAGLPPDRDDDAAADPDDRVHAGAELRDALLRD